MGGSLEVFSLTRKFQSGGRSWIFSIFGPLGKGGWPWRGSVKIEPRFFQVWVRNRAGENRPSDIRPNHFVYTCVGTRVSTHVSTRVGAFVWDYNREKPNFCGHSRVHLREHSREHLREPFCGSIGGSYFAFASSVLH